MAEPKTPETPATPVSVSLRAVHGRMQHPYTLTWFETDSTKPHVKDSWVTAQLEAEKLALA